MKEGQASEWEEADRIKRVKRKKSSGVSMC